MFLFPPVRFEGERGSHLDQDGRECGGRVFDVKLVGTRGIQTVVCTWCQRKLPAHHDRLAEPAPEFLAFV